MVRAKGSSKTNLAVLKVILCFARLRRFFTSSHSKRIPRSYRFVGTLCHLVGWTERKAYGALFPACTQPELVEDFGVGFIRRQKVMARVAVFRDLSLILGAGELPMAAIAAGKLLVP